MGGKATTIWLWIVDTHDTYRKDNINNWHLFWSLFGKCHLHGDKQCMMEDINNYHVQDTWFKQPYKNLQKEHSCHEEFKKYMVYALDKKVIVLWHEVMYP
jgi:hypothetical protein